MSYDYNLSQKFVKECSQIQGDISHIPDAKNKKGLEDNIEGTRGKIAALMTNPEYQPLMKVPSVRSSLQDTDAGLRKMEYAVIGSKDSKIQPNDLENISTCMKKLRGTFDQGYARQTKWDAALQIADPTQRNLELVEIFDTFMKDGDFVSAKKVCLQIDNPIKQSENFGGLFHELTKQHRFMEAAEIATTTQYKKPVVENDPVAKEINDKLGKLRNGRLKMLTEIVMDTREKIAEKRPVNSEGVIGDSPKVEMSAKEKEYFMKQSEVAVAIAAQIDNPDSCEEVIKSIRSQLKKDQIQNEPLNELIDLVVTKLFGSNNQNPKELMLNREGGGPCILLLLAENAFNRKDYQDCYIYGKAIHARKEVMPPSTKDKIMIDLWSIPDVLTQDNKKEIALDLIKEGKKFDLKDTNRPIVNKAIEFCMAENEKDLAAIKDLINLLDQSKPGIQDLWLNLGEEAFKVDNQAILKEVAGSLEGQYLEKFAVLCVDNGAYRTAFDIAKGGTPEKNDEICEAILNRVIAKTPHFNI